MHTGVEACFSHPLAIPVTLDAFLDPTHWLYDSGYRSEDGIKVSVPSSLSLLPAIASLSDLLHRLSVRYHCQLLIEFHPNRHDG